VASAGKYVRERKGWFYYERRVPQEVVRDAAAFQQHFKSQKLFRRSLRTRDRGDAYSAAALIHRECEGLIALALRRSAAPAAHSSSIMLRKVTTEVLHEIKAREHALTVRPWAQAYVWAERDPEQAEHFQQMVDDRELFAADRKRLLTTPHAKGRDPSEQTPLDSADEWIKALSLDAGEGSAERAMISIAIRNGKLAGERDIDRIIAGELPQVEPPVGPTSVDANTSPTLREAVELYVNDVAMAPKTRREVLVSLNLFETMVGNKRLADLQRRDFTSYIEQLALKQVGGRSADSVARPIARDTVKKRYGFLRAAINHAIEKHLHDGGNPASGIDVASWVKAPDKSVMPDKRPLKLNEMNLVFQHPWFVGCKSARPLMQTHKPGSIRLTGAHYWAPVVALYTGCRASELGGLKLNEIYLDDAFPHIHVRDNEYRRTKEGYARFVPILDALLEVGFAEYVRAVRGTNADRLFPDWQSPRLTGDFDKDDAAWSNASVIRAFNRTVINHRLRDILIPGARREVTFHGFRGAFKTMLGLKKHAVPPNVINEVIGHSKGELDTRYVGVVPLEETYPAIRSCGWDGLIIPAAPPLP
jgi:integrase